MEKTTGFFSRSFISFFQSRSDARAEPPGESVPALAREVEAQVYKFGALGTFLANFRDEAVRRRYTDLSSLLLTIALKRA